MGGSDEPQKSGAPVVSSAKRVEVELSSNASSMHRICSGSISMQLDFRRGTGLSVPFAVHEFSSAWTQVAEKYGISARILDRGSPLCERLLNTFASVVFVFETLVTPASIFGCVVASVCTIMYHKYAPDLAFNMSWTIISLAIIFPTSDGIKIGFKRRESALANIADMLAFSREIWGAVWTWRVKCADGSKFIRLIEAFDEHPEGKPGSSAEAERELHALFGELLAAMCAYFDTERWGRARHALRCGRAGRRQESELEAIAREQRLCVESCLARLQRLVQHLKPLGLDGGQCHRLDQYCTLTSRHWLRLTQLKEYRTPQAFRAFARVFMTFISVLYGPYYAYIVEEASLALAIAFACCVQLVLAGLFEVAQGLEDPFARRGGRGIFDSVKVPELCEISRRQLLRVALEAPLSWCERPEEKEEWGDYEDTDSVNMTAGSNPTVMHL